jgi:hypothetical protein
MQIKKTLLYILLSFNSYFLFSQAKIEFLQSKIYVDTLDEGENAPVNFIFKNIGDSNLIVTAVKSSCGCTVPKYDQRIIPPNTYDTILATYNSVGHLGPIDKMVKVESNAINGPQELYIMGNVVPYSSNIRLYYSSSVGNIKFALDKNKNITYTISKSINNRPDDISLVVYQSGTSNGFLSLDKAEMDREGVALKIMKQSNKSVSIENINPITITLSKDYTYILQFSLSGRTARAIHATLNGKKFNINFKFIE